MLEPDMNRKDWREHLDKIVRLGDKGQRVCYWRGMTDVDPRGHRRDVFDVMREHSDRGKVHLFQIRVEGGLYDYFAELR